MSDSHDHLPSIRQAVDFFNENKVEMVIHAGDLISPFTAKEFQNLNMPFEAVFGNNDGERNGLMRAYSDLCVLDDFKSLNISGRSIALIHGAQPQLVDSLVQCGQYDVVVRGHSHQQEIYQDKIHNTLVINPGETCGYLSGQKTLVLLDIEDMDYKLVKL